VAKTGNAIVVNRRGFELSRGSGPSLPMRDATNCVRAIVLGTL